MDVIDVKRGGKCTQLQKLLMLVRIDQFIDMYLAIYYNHNAFFKCIFIFNPIFFKG